MTRGRDVNQPIETKVSARRFDGVVVIVARRTESCSNLSATRRSIPRLTSLYRATKRSGV